MPDISDNNLPNFDYQNSLVEAPSQIVESKGLEAEFDFFKPQKVDPKTFKDLMDKGDLKDIFKEKEPAEVKDMSKAKSSLFNKKTLEKEKSGNPQPKREELKKKKERKTPEIADSEHTLKLCEFILYEFDLANPLGVECFNETNSIFIFFIRISLFFFFNKMLVVSHFLNFIIIYIISLFITFFQCWSCLIF